MSTKDEAEYKNASLSHKKKVLQVSEKIIINLIFIKNYQQLYPIKKK